VERPVIRGHGAPGEADSSTQELAALVEHGLFNDLVCLENNRLRNRQAEGLGGFRVNHELKLAGLLDREVGRFGPFKILST
jgi:hypothetical protein